jgi:hypothetical protein
MNRVLQSLFGSGLARSLSIAGLVFCLAPARAHAQIIPPPTFSHAWAGTVMDGFTLDGNEMWTGEDGGRIRHTVDGGLSWTFQVVPPEVKDPILRIHFLSLPKTPCTARIAVSGRVRGRRAASGQLQDLAWPIVPGWSS